MKTRIESFRCRVKLGTEDGGVATVTTKTWWHGSCAYTCAEAFPFIE